MPTQTERFPKLRAAVEVTKQGKENAASQQKQKEQEKINLELQTRKDVEYLKNSRLLSLLKDAAKLLSETEEGVGLYITPKEPPPKRIYARKFIKPSNGNTNMEL